MQQNIETSKPVSQWYGRHFPTTRRGMGEVVETVHSRLETNPAVEMFQGPGTALEFMLESWRYIWRHTLISMKGVFSEDELKLILDIHNSHMLTPIMYGSNALAVGISDSISLDNMAEKWAVGPAQIIERARSLNPIQAFCLEVWAVGFWYGRDQAQGLNDYIKILI